MMEKFFEIVTDFQTYKPLYPFGLGILLKILLDLNLGKWFVKKFYWISVRGIFRRKSNKISGIYKQYWHIENNKNYPNISDRQSLITLKQFNNYCYGEFFSKNGKENYYLFGEIIDRKIIGHWSNINSTLDYFGSFELTIINSKKIEGIWIGHSNENPSIINQYKWTFNAVTPTHKFLVPLQLIIFLKKKKSANNTKNSWDSGQQWQEHS